MKRIRRFPQRLIRLTSVAICLTLCFACLAIFPFNIGSVKDFGLSPQDNSNTRARRVPAIPPQAGPPAGILPNLAQMRGVTDNARRNGSASVQAPASIPSSNQRYRRGLHNQGQLPPSISSSPLLASVSWLFKRRENEVSFIANNKDKSDLAPLSDSEAGLFSRAAVLSPTQNPSNFAMARIAPGNRTGTGGEDLLSNNYNWNLPLVSLPGRGLDLGGQNK